MSFFFKGSEDNDGYEEYYERKRAGSAIFLKKQQERKEQPVAKFELIERLGLSVYGERGSEFINAHDLEALLQKAYSEERSGGDLTLYLQLKPKDERVSREEIEALGRKPLSQKDAACEYWEMLERILKHGVRE